VRASCPTTHVSADESVTSTSSSRRSIQELTATSSRLKGLCFDGTETQLLTAHMSKVLQERRDRLSRILAGMDPDDAVGPPAVVKDDARDASPTEQATTETADDPTDDSSTCMYDLEPSRSSPDVGPARVSVSPCDQVAGHDEGPVFQSVPPTLQEIEDAFAISEFDDRETSVAEDELEDRRCAMDASDASCDVTDGSTTGGFEPIRSPVDSQGSQLSPIRRANSFDDSTFVYERRDDHSIRVALSFDSLFLDAKHNRTAAIRKSISETSRFAPASTEETAASAISSFVGTIESPDMIKPKSAGACLLAVLTGPTMSSSTPDSHEMHGQDQALHHQEMGTKSDETNQLLNFVPPAGVVSVWLPKVTTVTDDADDDEVSRPDTALSSSSTLTTREERMGYLHNLAALQVKRPVPRYPPDEVSSSALLSVRGAQVKDEAYGRERVPSPHPGMGSVTSCDVGGLRGAVASSSSLIVDEDDRSLAMISDASSFDGTYDGTYDDTVTSGYLSMGGASERLNSLLGDDWTELSIMLSTHASFDESLEDGASVHRLLPSPPANLTAAAANEATPGSNRGVAIPSPAATSSVPLESCLLSSSGTSKETRAACGKRVAFAEVIPSRERLIKAYRKPPLLLVTEEVADSMCGTNGGLYSILLASNSGAASNEGTASGSHGGPSSTLPLSKPAKRSAGIQFLRLNPDFRCGAQGSTYDICIQSGFDVTTPWQWTKRRKYMPVKGGLYDMARESGLTKELMRSRAPLIIKTKPLCLCRQDDGEVMPEDVTDYECGATGNLYMAFESGGGDYVSMGSLYYLAARSGFKVSQ
jgi:hypothetical protein